MSYTISQVAARFGLSRSTLLYYDKIGLLSPGARSVANYRRYTERDVSAMKEISQLRNAGVALREIKRLLKRKTSRDDALRRRLGTINTEINLLRDQQRFILSLLGGGESEKSTRVLTREKWIRFLRSAGLDDAGMRRWHAEFERVSPEAHRDFLESLGIPEKEIALIRRWSAENAPL